MGSCIDLRNSTLIAFSLARMRFLIVLRFGSRECQGPARLVSRTSVSGPSAFFQMALRRPIRHKPVVATVRRHACRGDAWRSLVEEPGGNSERLHFCEAKVSCDATDFDLGDVAGSR
jgi:hypothetical protein